MLESNQQPIPVLTAKSPGNHVPVLREGRIRLRKTHPNLYLSLMMATAVYFLLGLNFLVLQPTFKIYHAPNWVWASAFVLIGTAMVVFLHIHRNLRLVRASTALAVAYILFLAAGTMEPWIDGEGSLQLPILYAFMAAIHFPILIEPFINPLTAKHDN